jgi:hypothetical protein
MGYFKKFEIEKQEKEQREAYVSCLAGEFYKHFIEVCKWALPSWSMLNA